MNKEKLRIDKKNGALLDVILKGKGNWVGRVIRGKAILATVLEGTVEGKRRIGRK